MVARPGPPLPTDCEERLRRLYDYWSACRPSGQALPGRQHIDPCAVPDLLAWIWLLDVARHPLRFRYRLLGTEQVDAMKRDITGRFLDEVHPSFRSSDSYPQYVAAAEHGAVGYRRGPPTFHISKDYLSIERLLLPLARNGSDVDMVLAITVYHRPG
jgi:hypothetical protein